MTWNIVYQHLGYLEAPEDLITNVPSIITDLCTRITALDTALDTAVADSMAVTVGELSVNYTNHIHHLRIQGTRLVKQLSHLSNIPVAYDKFQGKTPKELGSSPLAVRSY